LYESFQMTYSAGMGGTSRVPACTPNSFLLIVLVSQVPEIMYNKIIITVFPGYSALLKRFASVCSLEQGSWQDRQSYWND
jgi:hypothetical protein